MFSRHGHRMNGFTLIEILLVLVLLAGSAVAVIMTLPEPQDDRVKNQASRFYQLVQLLGEDAILNGVDFGVRIERHGYEFLQLRAKEATWQPLENSRYFSTVEVEDDITLTVEIGSAVWKDEDRLFKPGSLFDPDMFIDEKEEKKTKPPQILVMASGEYTPFTVAFEVLGENEFWRVHGDEVGHLWLLSPQESTPVPTS